MLFLVLALLPSVIAGPCTVVLPLVGQKLVSVSAESRCQSLHGFDATLITEQALTRLTNVELTVLESLGPFWVHTVPSGLTECTVATVLQGEYRVETRPCVSTGVATVCKFPSRTGTGNKCQGSLCDVSKQWSACGVCGQPETECARCPEDCGGNGHCDPVTDKCLCEYGWTGRSCSSSTVNCGNGRVDRGEECDDGNTAGGDGCSALCKLEVSTNHFCKTVAGKTHCCPTTVPGAPCSGRVPTPSAPEHCTQGVCSGCVDGYGGKACEWCETPGYTPNVCGICAAPGDNAACRGRLCPNHPRGIIGTLFDACGVCGGGNVDRKKCPPCLVDAAFTTADTDAHPRTWFKSVKRALKECARQRRIDVASAETAEVSSESMAIESDSTVLGGKNPRSEQLLLEITDSLEISGRDMTLHNAILESHAAGCPDAPVLNANVYERFEMSDIRMKLPGCRGLTTPRMRIHVHSPFTLANSDFSNHDGSSSAYLFDVVMDGGHLTVANNTFHNVSGGAIRVSGFNSVEFTNNVFTLSGGDTLPLVHLTPNVTSSDPTQASLFIVSGNTQSGGNGDPLGREVMYFAGDPWNYNGVTDNTFDKSTGIGIRFEALRGDAARFGDDAKSDLRFLAVINPLASGLGSWVATGTEPVPTEANECNALCPEVVPTIVDPFSSTVSWFNSIQTSLVQTDPSGDVFELVVSAYSDTPGRPVVSFSDILGDDLRQRDTCSSVEETFSAPQEPWPQVCNASFVNAADGWVQENVTAPAAGLTAWSIRKNFTLFELANECSAFGSAAPSVIPTLVGATPVYQFTVTVGFYTCQDWASEARGAAVYHKSSTKFQITVTSSGAVVSEFASTKTGFDARVLQTYFEPAPSNQLKVIFTTEVGHLMGDTNSTYLVGNSTTTTPPLSSSTHNGSAILWTLEQVGAGVDNAHPLVPCTNANADADVVCEQIWCATTTNAALTDFFDVFIRNMFTIVYDGVLREDADPILLNAHIITSRTRASSLSSVIPSVAQPYFDHALTRPVSAGQPLLDGEKIRVLVTSLGSLVQTEITDAEVCCSTQGTIVPYDPENPYTTGCNTLSVGVANNRFVVYSAADNSAYAPLYMSERYTLGAPAMSPAQDALEFTVRRFILGDNINQDIECAVQVWHKLFDLSSPGGPSEIPRPDPVLGVVGAAFGKGRNAHWASYFHENTHKVFNGRTARIRNTRFLRYMDNPLTALLPKERRFERSRMKAFFSYKARGDGNEYYPHAKPSTVNPLGEHPGEYLDVDSFRVACPGGAVARQSRDHAPLAECFDPRTGQPVSNWWFLGESNATNPGTGYQPDTDKEDEFSATAVVVIAVLGGVLLLVLGVTIYFCYIVRNQRERIEDMKQSAAQKRAETQPLMGGTRRPTAPARRETMVPPQFREIRK